MTDLPKTESETDLSSATLGDPPFHQRSARNDPSMRDGDSGHGNPNEYPPDDESTDRDIGDTAAVAEEASEEAGVLDAVPANEVELHSPAAMPIDGYQRLTVRQIMAKLNTLSRDEVEAVLAFETAHRKRKTLLGQLERRLHGEVE